MSTEQPWQDRLAAWLHQGPALLILDQPVAAGELGTLLTEAGLVAGTVDLSSIADKEPMMRAFQRDLAWPDWFGANWDALADLLAGPEEPEAQPMALILIGWSGFAARAPDLAATLAELIEELSDEPRSLLIGAILLPS